MKKLVAWSVAGVLLTGLLISWGMGVFGEPVAVRAIRVHRGNIEAFIEEEGKTRLPRTYLVSMPCAGRLQAVTLREGDRVSRGQLVAALAPEDLALRVQVAQATVRRLDAEIKQNLDTTLEELIKRQALQMVESMERAAAAAAERVEAGRAKADYADSYLRRMTLLFERKAIAEDDLEQARLQQVEARSSYVQDQLTHRMVLALKGAIEFIPAIVDRYIAERELADAILREQRAEALAQCEMALLDQHRGELRSPVDGVVLQRFVASEQVLPAGAAILELGRLEDLEVEADFLTSDAIHIKPGQRVVIHVSGSIGGAAQSPGYFEGKVERIFPAAFAKVSSLGVEEQRVKVIVQFEKEALSRVAQLGVGVGYQVQIRVITGQKAEALLAPRTACLGNVAEETQIFTVENRRAKIRHVRIGLVNDWAVEVLDGLHEGELVVLSPGNDVVPGKKVVIEELLDSPLGGTAASQYPIF